MRKLIYGVGLPVALFLSMYMFIQRQTAFGVAALVVAVILFVTAIPKGRQGLSAQKESYRRLAEKLGAETKWKPRLAGIYRNRQVEIRSERNYRKLFCTLSVTCGPNARGLSFYIQPAWSNNWADFNDEIFKRAVLTEERQRILKENSNSAYAAVLILKDSTVTYREGDWMVGHEKIDRFNLMLDIACDVADLVDAFSQTHSSTNFTRRPEAIAHGAVAAG